MPNEATTQERLRKRAALNRSAAGYLSTHLEHDDSRQNARAAELDEEAADRIDALEDALRKVARFVDDQDLGLTYNSVMVVAREALGAAS